MSYERLHNLNDVLESLGCALDRLEERFVRARGPGGQHVNRSATAVQLCDPQSGIIVRSEAFRSQLRNRIAARELLIERLQQAAAQAHAERVAAREKRRRQKRQPSRAAKARNIDEKRGRGQLKRLRRRVDDGGD